MTAIKINNDKFVVGDGNYINPKEQPPPKGTMVQVLTPGGVITDRIVDSNVELIAWAPYPKIPDWAKQSIGQRNNDSISRIVYINVSILFPYLKNILKTNCEKDFDIEPEFIKNLINDGKYFDPMHINYQNLFKAYAEYDYKSKSSGYYVSVKLTDNVYHQLSKKFNNEGEYTLSEIVTVYLLAFLY